MHCSDKATYAVIPAAGRGSRLGLDIPKILLPLTSTDTVWSILRHKLFHLVRHIHIVMSPEGESKMRVAAAEDIANGKVSISIQPKPIGMGDAIFRAEPYWNKAENILIVWGDQVSVSETTLRRTLYQHSHHSQQLTLPLVNMKNPYVEYIFDVDKLIQIKQTREGDLCNPKGFADVGTFLLSTDTLHTAWKAYLHQSPLGNHTNEINFLPFLVYLSQQGWRVNPLLIDDITETRGINTPEDLRYIQKQLERRKTLSESV